MTTKDGSRRLTRKAPRNQSVRKSSGRVEPRPGEARLHGQVALQDERVCAGRLADGSPRPLDTPKTLEAPEAPGAQKSPRGISRRRALSVLGIGAGALLAGQALAGDTIPPASSAPAVFRSAPPDPGGYAPDGTAGRAAAFPLRNVQLLDSPFRQNQARNTTYLMFLDPERMLRSFRLNYGETSAAEPLGGWERPDSLIRGHMTGHLLSGLALTYANTGDEAVRTRGRYLVGQLSALLEQAAGPMWSPYYMIHKYLAGMIDQYQLAGDEQALAVAIKLADWVGWRTDQKRIPYDHMQAILNTEFGGLPEALANLYTITGRERYLATAQRFYHAAILDPLADGLDVLPGLQANVTTPKILACLRMW